MKKENNKGLMFGSNNSEIDYFTGCSECIINTKKYRCKNITVVTDPTV